MSGQYNSNVHHRKSIRLKEYDYSQDGAFFITICVEKRENRFGEIKEGNMLVNDAGKMIKAWWRKLFEKFPDTVIDAYIIMPNHFHGIIQITSIDKFVGAIPCNRPHYGSDKGENTVSPLQPIPNTYNGLGQYISWFKRMSTNEYIRNVKENNWKRFDKRLWQRNYYEHIICNEDDLNKIREYILTNPENWEKDTLYEPNP